MFKKFLEDPYNKIIVLCVKEKRTQQEEAEVEKTVRKLNMEELLQTARENEVCSIMYPVLKKYYQDAEWEQEYVKVKEQMEWMVESIEKLSLKFQAQNIPLIALKNAGIALAFIDDYGKCPMGDIDTLVRKNDFIRAHKIAVENGFVFRFRSVYEKENLEEAFIDGSTEYSYCEGSRRMWLEIAWRAVAGRWINRNHEAKTEQLFQKAVCLESKNIYILSPEDNLLQVSIHTAKHSYVRKPGFRLHLDVERIVNYCSIDWALFLKKTQEAHTKTAVYFSLKCAKDLFGTAIPEQVLKTLRPNLLKRCIIIPIIEQCMCLHGKYKKMGRLKFILFQVCLYDDIHEVLAVAFPGKEQLHKKFSSDTFIKAQILHLLDLIGIRKEKQNNG